MGSRKRPLAKAAKDHGEKLTRAGLVRMELLGAPPALAPYVTTFFRLRCDEAHIRDVQPSSIGLIALMLRGEGHIRFLDGRVEPSRRYTLLTPTDAAATFEVQGPWDVFGAMLSPVGWASLTGLSAGAHGNRLHDGADLLPAPLAEAGRSLLESVGDLSDAQMIERLGDAILASARPLPAGHAAFIKQVADWLAQSLSPEIEDLFARVAFSQRQTQRLTDHYFGLPPKRLARKYRALRAAVILSRPGITADEIASVQDHFYDQPHMIREIRLFAGRTPARIGDPDKPYLNAFLDLRDFREGGPRMAPIPDDLRA
jgi:AraC-like DNA-binding protein